MTFDLTNNAFDIHGKNVNVRSLRILLSYLTREFEECAKELFGLFPLFSFKHQIIRQTICPNDDQSTPPAFNNKICTLFVMRTKGLVFLYICRHHFYRILNFVVPIDTNFPQASQCKGWPVKEKKVLARQLQSPCMIAQNGAIKGRNSNACHMNGVRNRNHRSMKDDAVAGAKLLAYRPQRCPCKHAGIQVSRFAE